MFEKAPVPVTEPWIVNMHGKCDEEGHNPGKRYQQVGEEVLPVVIDTGLVDCHEPVNADTKEGVDGNIAEESISCNPSLTQGDAPAPAS